MIAENPPAERILEATLDLLRDGGRTAVTTRAVSARAGVQAQTIYRRFGDMRGLLDAVVARGFTGFLDAKGAQPSDSDPVEELRRGWDLHIAFARANPAVYALMYGEPRTEAPPAARQVYDVLRGIVSKAAAAGRLKVPVDAAASMIYAAGVGVALTTIVESHVGPATDTGLSARTRDAILDAVTVTVTVSPGRDDESRTAAWHAVSLQSMLSSSATDFSTGETALLKEWLNRIAGAEARPAD
ncbi:TetR/AcrR family transcriptional regulator [Mycolicibacterium sp. P1-18]|uniref:TetR/AcrR family transcriptional regulator n=1 Tax=Mycolicibacterium sp. P1-18 TaxID=2024615 RepID=UPI0011F275AD|nr:TetR/AcrR family transcriptional regulator [Mycolicibacterium sp. P1-18]KAA0099482.1 TetR/AcrR family transcriptional regulator [Mycolicibacterium sp. P1-18]